MLSHRMSGDHNTEGAVRKGIGVGVVSAELPVQSGPSLTEFDLSVGERKGGAFIERAPTGAARSNASPDWKSMNAAAPRRDSFSYAQVAAPTR